MLTPFLGAVTGACYHATEPSSRLTIGLGKLFGVSNVIGYFIGLWIALVLGLARTMWN